MIGADYCTWAPDDACYPSSNGWPSCCVETGADCPIERPACESSSVPIVGAAEGEDYCTWAPDDACYPYSGGWPSCCASSGGASCPSTRPACEGGADAPGSSYCTFSPDLKCYPSTNGWPACCSSDNATACPEERPACDEPLDGGDYCTWAPDEKCYPSTNGWPACCSEDGGADCPTERPSCQDPLLFGGNATSPSTSAPSQLPSLRGDLAATKAEEEAANDHSSAATWQWAGSWLAIAVATVVL